MDGVNAPEWLLIKNSFRNAYSRVKWEGLMSNSSPVEQGVTQGIILDPTEYKRFFDLYCINYNGVPMDSNWGLPDVRPQCVQMI